MGSGKGAVDLSRAPASWYISDPEVFMDPVFLAEIDADAGILGVALIATGVFGLFLWILAFRP